MDLGLFLTCVIGFILVYLPIWSYFSFSLLVMGIKKNDGPRRGSSDQHQVEMAEPRAARQDKEQTRETTGLRLEKQPRGAGREGVRQP